MVVYTYVHKHVRTTWYSTSQYLPVKSSQIVKVFSCQIAPCSHCPGAKDSISSQISSESQSPCGHRKQSFETDMNLGRYRTHHHTTSSWCLSDVNLSLDFFPSSNSRIPQRFDERVAWRSTPSSLLTFLCHATRHWGSFRNSEFEIWTKSVSPLESTASVTFVKERVKKNTSTSWVVFM